MYAIRETQHGQTVVVKEGVVWIPSDENNSDYRDYLSWLAQGNTPDEWEDEE